MKAEAATKTQRNEGDQEQFAHAIDPSEQHRVRSFHNDSAFSWFQAHAPGTIPGLKWPYNRRKSGTQSAPNPLRHTCYRLSVRSVAGEVATQRIRSERAASIVAEPAITVSRLAKAPSA